MFKEISSPTELKRNYVITGIALAMSISCRSSNIFIFPFVIFSLYLLIRRGVNLKFAKNFFIAFISAITISIPYFIINKLTWGKWIVTNNYAFSSNSSEIPQFHWLDPSLLKTLFSTQHGLFTWSPILLFSLFGFILVIKNISLFKSKWLFLALIFSFLFLWYINSSWWSWWFGASFGARAFLELSILFVALMTIVFELIISSNKAIYKIGSIVFGIICIGYTYWLMLLFLLHKIHRVKPFKFSELFTF